MFPRYRSSAVVSFSLLVILFLLSLILTGCAAPVIKMPKPMPDIVKEYKSVVVHGNRPGMQDSGVRVKEGDYIMILADGEIDVRPAKGGYTRSPNGSLLIRIGEKNFAWRYYDAYLIATAVKENGNIYMGVHDGPMNRYGEPSKPEYYLDNSGYFVADIIVWKQNDHIRIADVLEEASRNNPKNTSLRISAGIAKNQKEMMLAEKKKTEEVEKTKEAIAALKAKEVLGGKDPEKEKQMAALTESFQKALQDLEELKKKVAEQTEKEKGLTARLQSLEEEKSKQGRVPLIIAIASPKDGISVDS